MTLAEFLESTAKNMLLNEGIRSRDLEKAMKLMESYLAKYKIYVMPDIRSITIDGKSKMAVMVWADNGSGACFIWDRGESNQIEKCLFTQSAAEAMVSWVNNEEYTWEVLAEAKGANTVQMLKLVVAVLTGKIRMTPEDVRNYIKDAQIFESLVTEASDPGIEKLKREKQNLYMRIRYAKRKNLKYDDLQQQYDELVAKLADARVSVRGNVKTTQIVDDDVEKYQSTFEDEERATPEERFEDMQSYIYNVITGIRPLALICGAPGVGKTYRIMKTIEGVGKIQGTDFGLLKGKCTATALYMALHDFKEEGQLVVFDDCDSIFKDDDAINLIKAACDSSDNRYVSWSVSKAPTMSEEQANMCDDAVFNAATNRWYYPREFEFCGSVIIITNFRAGQIDTAIRNRALICDLDFTVDEVLELIRNLAPKIKPDVLTMEAKEQALNYLQELANKGAPVELSIRSFTLCAGIFGSNATERSKMRQIKEQMRLQSMRGGKKY